MPLLKQYSILSTMEPYAPTTVVVHVYAGGGGGVGILQDQKYASCTFHSSSTDTP